LFNIGATPDNEQSATVSNSMPGENSEKMAALKVFFVASALNTEA
jgi:hypothetical protein